MKLINKLEKSRLKLKTEINHFIHEALKLFEIKIQRIGLQKIKKIRRI